MSRKIINIKRAKMDRKKPLLSMSHKELEETLHDVGGSIYEGILSEARSNNLTVRLVCVVLSKGAANRIVCAYEEYGDGENVELCKEIISELKPFEHTGETLRVATFDVDLNRSSTFKLPSKKTWDDRENDDEKATKAWRRYTQMHEARGLVTVIVTWLVTTNGRRIVTWDVDHGDGAAMYEGTAITISGIRWNKLLAKKERLEAVAYEVPNDAMSEILGVKS